jgi:V/A-type H+-transporting ATPase subunit F
MQIFLISDNSDTAMGFRLIGVAGVVVHSKEEFENEIYRALENKKIGLLLITEGLVESYSELVYSLKYYRHTIIVQIPDRHGSKKSESDVIGGYLKNALGVSL